MINLNIQQNNEVLKNIDENLLEFLYNFSKGLDNDVPQYMKGRLEVMHGYADAISFLTSKFEDLYINSAQGTYIRFKDSVVQEKLANKWGDGFGITTQEAAVQTSGYQIKSLFKGNTYIISFNEFKYFIGIKELPSETFRSCSNLESIDLQNVERITGNSCFWGCNKLTNIGGYSNLTRIDPDAFNYTDLTGEYDFSNINEFKDDNKEALGFQNTLNLISIKMPAAQETLCSFYGSGVYHITNCLGIKYIGHERVRNCKNLQEMDCPNLERITGSNNFFGDISLKTVNFPKLNYIEGTNVFSGCKSLEEITLGPITKFNTNIFSECNNLTTINCDFSKIVSIEQNAFYDCSNIAITFDCPNCVSLGNNSFRNCTSLTSVNFPNLSSIGSDSFNNCKSLTTVNIVNVESISNGSFVGCKSLISINIPNVNIINQNAFYNCTNLQSVTVGNNLNQIYSQAFKQCESLTTINNINWENIQIIGDYAFEGCNNFLNDYEEPIVFSSLTSLTANQIQGFRAPHLKFPVIENIGKLSNSFTKTVELHLGITSLPSFVFNDCKLLTSVSKLGNVTSVGNECFRYDYLLESVDFSNKLKIIGNYAFSECRKINYISAETIYPTSIGNDAFNGCSLLKGRINLLECTTIGSGAFYGCTSLTSIGSFSSELTSIGAWCFYNCSSLTGNLDIPASVTSIGDGCFRKLTSLTSITFNSTTPPSRPTGTQFEESTYIIYVPASAVETYKSAWTSVASRIQAKP